MPHASVDGIRLYYEEVGEGAPLVFVHEFAGESGAGGRRSSSSPGATARSPTTPAATRPRTSPTTRRRTRRSARSRTSGACSTTWGSRRRTCAGSRWAATPCCTSASPTPSARSAGRRRLRLRQRRPGRLPPGLLQVAKRFEDEAWPGWRTGTAAGPTRVQFLDKDPKGWQEFHGRLAAGSARGHALTMQGVQMKRPSVYDLGARMEALRVPTLVVTGDEDEPCLEPALFIKRKIPSAGLVVLPKAGTPSTSRSPRRSTARCSTSSRRWTRGDGDSATRPRSRVGDPPGRRTPMRAADILPVRFNAAAHFVDRNVAEGRGAAPAFLLADGTASSPTPTSRTSSTAPATAPRAGGRAGAPGAGGLPGHCRVPRRLLGGDEDRGDPHPGEHAAPHRRLPLLPRGQPGPRRGRLGAAARRGRSRARRRDGLAPPRPGRGGTVRPLALLRGPAGPGLGDARPGGDPPGRARLLALSSGPPASQGRGPPPPRHGGVHRDYAKQVLDLRPTDRVFSIAKLYFAYGLGNAGTSR